MRSCGVSVRVCVRVYRKCVYERRAMREESVKKQTKYLKVIKCNFIWGETCFAFTTSPCRPARARSYSSRPSHRVQFTHQKRPCGINLYVVFIFILCFVGAHTAFLYGTCKLYNRQTVETNQICVISEWYRVLTGRGTAKKNSARYIRRFFNTIRRSLFLFYLVDVYK